MDTINLYRKPDFMLMARSFKIYIDNKLVSTIDNGEHKTLEIPPDSKELTVRIMNYTSKPIELTTGENGTYLIRQNLISNIVVYCTGLLAIIYFCAKFINHIELPILLYIALPFILISVYYSTFGRKQVIQLRVINEEK